MDFSAKSTSIIPCPWADLNFDITIPELPPKAKLHPLHMKHLTLDNIQALLSRNPAISHIVFTDGSLLKATGRAGCSIVVTDLKFTELFTKTLRIHNWASTLQAESVGILMALEYVHRNVINALIVCDAKSALLALNSIRPEHKLLSYEAKDWLRKITNQCRTVHLLWTFSHVGLKMHDRADQLAKSACSKPDVECSYGIPLQTFKSVMIQESVNTLEGYRQALGPESYTVHHYNRVCINKVQYGKYKVKSRLCDLVTARIRLGYRYLWQLNINQRYDPDKVQCKLCSQPFGHSLQHYIVECSHIAPFRPSNLSYHELCRYFTESGVMPEVLLAFPLFANPY